MLAEKAFDAGTVSITKSGLLHSHLTADLRGFENVVTNSVMQGIEPKPI
jgi:hypothetical protein